ncbi:beta-ketoacyl synthase N-terminal-like domain-containing protein [Clostridium butyricum]
MSDLRIAVVGMAGRFPDADSVENLFENCLKGIVSIKRYNDDELIEAGIKKKNIEHENYIKYGSFIKDIDKFDNTFFKMTQLEASLIDPQQRLFLKCSWEALENANYSPEKYDGRIGVFSSSSLSTYLINNILKSNYYRDKDFDYPTLIGNDKDFLSTRVSYKLGLSGPSISLQCGCSSSLAAIHYACQSIKNNESDMAIAGGVSITVPQKMGYFYKEGGNFSKDGQVRAFDINASGMVKGNGCGVVILKALSKAIEDHDYIYAVIDSSSINNDGKNKVGYTAPSISGQTSVIKDSLYKSGIDYNKIRYIEAHGTGTRLGDPIEMKALSNSYKINNKNKIIVGSVKSNIGHLDAAAGVTGFIKASMILNKGVIPKSVNFKSPNPQINFDKIPFRVESKENIKLNKSDKNYVAVSSLGIGGTNVHIILEDFRNNKSHKNYNKSYVLPLSAKTEQSLEMQKSNLLEFLKKHENLNISDVSFSLCFGRTDFKVRDYIIASDITEAIERLSRNNIDSYDNEKLKELADQWKEGKLILWESLFNEEDVYRIPLPTYPFDEKSLWISPSNQINQEEVYTNKANMSSLHVSQLTKKDIINKIVDIWSTDLDMDIKTNDDFFDIGGDSLIAIDIISDLNKVFEINLNLNILSKISTPELLGDYIYVNKINSSSIDLQNITKIISSEKSNKNLFLVHPAGGSTYCYNVLAKYLEENINIYAISFPENIDVNLEINDLAKIYAEEINKIQPDGNLYIGGYSFGGNVAMQMVKNLNDKGRKIEKIFMIDSIPPEGYSEEGLNKEKCINKFPALWRLMTGNDKESESYVHLNNNGNLDEIIDNMKNEGIISKKISNSSIKRTFNTWISNNNALSSQSKDIQVDATIIIFFAKENLPKYLFNLAEMKHVTHELWSKYTSKELKSIKIDGNHYSMFSDKNNIRILAKKFNEELKNL